MWATRTLERRAVGGIHYGWRRSLDIWRNSGIGGGVTYDFLRDAQRSTHSNMQVRFMIKNQVFTICGCGIMIRVSVGF
ncbi:hypothetical protein GCM10010912_69540 [Paenibacillus albidus]|uniref:Uncharacterized protein n=1 Tax=Paenibacillus albidus TaxID=2041023 RepID=A0A917FZG2_9BACL|nr:hypothetical protein GCM10010912_69540 [Paenibacillus albidus]